MSGILDEWHEWLGRINLKEQKSEIIFLQFPMTFLPKKNELSMI